MASKDDLLPAGKYELSAQWDELTSKPGQPAEYVRHSPGDVVELTQEDANRLARVISKPGEREKAEAERLQRLADEAKTRADEASERASAAGKNATAASRAKPTAD